jgi:hypothetical protein
MLQRLVIRDFVIVDRLELEFAAGFGAVLFAGARPDVAPIAMVRRPFESISIIRSALANARARKRCRSVFTPP